jgi:hypothetical protein
MTMYAVYEIETGRLVSTGSTVTDDETFQARKCGKVEVPDANGIWNPGTLSFDPRPADPVMIEPDVFFDQFTPAEFGRIYSSDDLHVKYLLKRLELRRTPIDLLGDTVSQALALLQSLNLLDTNDGSRVAAIQAWRPAA